MKKWFGILCALLALVSCHNKRQYVPSHIEEVDVHIIRFDCDLMQVQRETAMENIRGLYAAYPDFMPVFVEGVLGVPSADTAFLAQALPDFLEDTLYGFRHTNEYEKEVFQDVHPIERQLSMAFSRAHYLFPDWTIPRVTMFVSGFNAPILYMHDGIAIGADMYLGSDYPYYNRVVNDYQKHTMRPECIPADVVSAWLYQNIPYTSARNRLLENMIYRGKVMYLLAQLFPKESGWNIMGYTPEQWNWCLQYERATWNRMMDKKDLFKTEQRILSSYLNDGPFTSEITQDSPGRLGIWMGWRIVDSYMEHNQDVTIQQLMQQGDAQLILENSFYKP